MCPAFDTVIRRLPQHEANNSALSSVTKGSFVLATTTEPNGNFRRGMGPNPIGPRG